MTKDRLNFWNGLAVVALVFSILSIIPLAIVVSVGVQTGSDYTVSTMSLAPQGNQTFTISSAYNSYTGFWSVGSGGYFEVYALTDVQYENWLKQNQTIAPLLYYEKMSGYSAHKQFVDFDGYLVIINPSTEKTLSIEYYIMKINAGISIAATVLAIIFTVFFTILVLHTIGYIFKALILIPLSGGNRRNEVVYRDSYRGDRPDKAYSNEQRHPRQTENGSVSQRKGKEETIHDQRMREEPVHIQASLPRYEGGNYVIAKEPKRYTNNVFFEKIKDQSGTAEKILIGIGIFWVLIAIFAWIPWMLLAFAFPLFLSAYIVYIVRIGRYHKAIELISAYRTIYLGDLAKKMEISKSEAEGTIWGIIRLGLAPIAFDVNNSIVVDATKVNVSNEHSVKVAAPMSSPSTPVVPPKAVDQKIHSIESNNILFCPFCDVENPGDSRFCIKCGASLRPAK